MRSRLCNYLGDRAYAETIDRLISETFTEIEYRMADVHVATKRTTQRWLVCGNTIHVRRNQAMIPPFSDYLLGTALYLLMMLLVGTCGGVL